MNILVTGASGFMARTLISRLCENDGLHVTGLSRKAARWQAADTSPAKHAFATADFMACLAGIDVVVHAAARAHVLKDEAADPLAEFRKVNVDFTLNIARQAAVSGVKRFIFISTIGVNGTCNDRPFTATDSVAPEEPYAISKWEAEQGLVELCKTNSMELVIIRPPLMYGPGAPGNFANLVKWVASGIPLPLGAIANQRSLIGLDNMVDLIATCLDHPAAAGKVLLASDGEDVSTSELLRRVAKAMGKPARLIPVPEAVLRAGAAVLGKRAMANRLLGSLRVDISKTTELLGWTPPFSLDEGLSRCFKDSAQDTPRVVLK
ncbi:Nucleoside-diphosphate-sugar epimerase [Pseudomonas sp. ok272]|uniref:UDP-glucose 4-epimerase family protein n=1 Tax=unclassified Pseudomonas TaxID=196821 RepID=UPI0008BB7FA9|nr:MULTISPECIES: SDR family oxidoreductase [unclassified Pseudomonas]SEM63469.1 Nucleoside-diphosphate-sugar epimerase [Pseudomonas sp. ok272]SFM46473.1 Nucleoside-diphosphate-sugar epimerase [Pseudomonas sp. ok602]